MNKRTMDHLIVRDVFNSILFIYIDSVCQSDPESFNNISNIITSFPQRIRSAPQRVVGRRVRAAPSPMSVGASRGAAARGPRGHTGERDRHQDRGELRVCAAEFVL